METKKLIKQLASAGYGIRSYSGRGMFGRECVSVSGDDAQEIMLDVIDILTDIADVHEFVGHMRCAHSDSLGKGVVLYWPAAKWSSELEECAQSAPLPECDSCRKPGILRRSEYEHNERWCRRCTDIAEGRSA